MVAHTRQCGPQASVVGVRKAAKLSIKPSRSHAWGLRGRTAATQNPRKTQKNGIATDKAKEIASSDRSAPAFLLCSVITAVRGPELVSLSTVTARMWAGGAWARGLRRGGVPVAAVRFAGVEMARLGKRAAGASGKGG